MKLLRFSLLYLLLAALTAASPSFGSQADVLTPQQQTWLKKNPTIRMGFQNSLEPLVIDHGNGNYSGFLIDLYDEIGELLGIEFDIVIKPWRDVIHEVKTGELHGLLAGTDSLITQHNLLGSEKIFTLYRAIFSLNSKPLRTLEELIGKRIAIPDAGAEESVILADIRDKAYVTTRLTTTELLQALSNREVDAVIGTSLTNFYLSKHPTGSIHTSYLRNAPSTKIKLVVNQNHPELRDILNVALQHLGANRLNQLTSKWLQAKGSLSHLLLSPEEQYWLNQHPQIRLGFHNKLEPLTVNTPSAAPSGALIEIYQLIEDVIGTQIDIEIGDWQDMLKKANDRQLDGLLVGAESLTKNHPLLATAPLFTSHGVLFKNKTSHHDIKSLQAPSGKKIAYQRTVVVARKALEKLQLQNDISIVPVNSSLEGMFKVLDKEVDFYYGLNIEEYIRQKHRLSDIEIALRNYDNTYDGHIIIRDDWPQLVTILNKAIAHIGHNKINQIINRWIAPDNQSNDFYLSSSEAELLAQHPTWLHGVLDNRFPAEDIDTEGTFIGVSSNIVELMQQKLGIDIQQRFYQSPQKLGEAANKGLTLVSFASPSWAKQHNLELSIPYMQYPIAVYVHHDTTQLQSYEQLKGKTLALIKDAPLTDLIRHHHPDIIIKTYDTPLMAFEAVQDKEADAIAIATVAADYILKKENLGEIKTAFLTAEKASIHFAVPKHYSALTPIINKFISSISDQDKALIMQSWMNMPTSKEIDWSRMTQWIIAISLFALLLLLSILAWNRRLSVEIIKRNETEKHLNQALAQAELANQAKSEFLASMSHEIRTPMNGVLGLTELLADTPLNDQQHHLLTTIKSSANTLLTVINDILDNAKIEAGKLELEEKDFILSDFIASTTAPFKLLSKEHVNFEIETAPTMPSALIGDTVRLQQICTNLLNNAFKFTANGRILIRFNSQPLSEQNLLLIIEVKDTGIGITEERCKHLFDAFTQADQSTTRQYGGTGLGLTICQQLVKLMGGQIEVDSTLGKGSTFKVQLPMRIGTAQTPASRQGDSESYPLHVLIAEDNAVNQMVAKGILSKLGASCEIVGDGKAAVQAVKLSDRFDMIFMDCEMPVMDGYEATKAIRQWESESQRQASFICAFTAHALKEHVDRCYYAGMNAHIAKPVNSEAVKAIFAQACKTK
jgi:signal transduction histidine kinase